MIKVFMGRNLCHGEGLSRHCEERQALGLAATKPWLPQASNPLPMKCSPRTTETAPPFPFRDCVLFTTSWKIVC